MQNLNPTILNAADLPTRQLPSSKPGVIGNGEGYNAVNIFAPALSSGLADLRDPFAPVSPYNDFGAGSESDDGELMEEPIDEQEIFGAFISSLC
jgi:hypothetical protein